MLSGIPCKIRSAVMMHLKRLVLLFMLAVLLVSIPGTLGCITLADTFGAHTEGPRVYGGTRLYFHMDPFYEEVYWWPLILLWYVVDFTHRLMASGRTGLPGKPFGEYDRVTGERWDQDTRQTKCRVMELPCLLPIKETLVLLGAA